MVTARRRSRLRTSVQEALLGHLVAGATARAAAELAGVNRHTATRFFHTPREVIAERPAADAPGFQAGDVEVDESDFVGVRKGQRGRGAAGKGPVFGLLKRGG